MKPGYFVKLVIAVILVLGIVILPACTPTQSNSMIGNPGPFFQLKGSDGSYLSSQSLSGKTILINFWSTTCPPCVEEMPYFQKLQDSWSRRNDAMLVMIDLNDDLPTAQNFIQKNQYTFQFFLDSGYITAQIFDIRFTPTSVLIDRQGIVRLYKVGEFANFADIEKQIAPFLK